MKARSIMLSLGNRLPSSFVNRLQSDTCLAKALRPIVNRLVPSGYEVVQVMSGPARGTFLYIEPRKEKFYWTGLHETHVQLVLSSLLEPGDVFWDIGSHIGFMSMLASRLVGPQGRVIAFEPVLENRVRFIRSMEANRFSNVDLHPYAITDRTGVSKLHGRGSSLMWTIDETRGTEETDEAVETESINSLLKRLPAPSVLKVDAEGAELEVLRGASDLSGQHASLIVEFSHLGMVAQAQALFPNHQFSLIGQNHWLLMPSAD